MISSINLKLKKDEMNILKSSMKALKFKFSSAFLCQTVFLNFSIKLSSFLKKTFASARISL